MNGPRIFLAISGHGYGHLGQVTPLISELRRDHPEIQLTVQSSLPEDLLASRISRPFTHIATAPDIGMVMNGPMTALLDESLSAYAEFHSNWPQKLKQQKVLLQDSGCDLLIADIPYLPLAAAQSLGLPNIAVCSFSWLTVLKQYCGDTKQTHPWLETMLTAYNGADLFLCPEPSVPMPELTNTVAIPPLVRIGKNRREEINQRLKLKPEQRLVMLSLGGISPNLSLDKWPHHPDITWLIDRGRIQAQSSIRDLAELSDISFTDILTSVDALVTKPGYGIFTEAVFNQTPILYVKRGDWPEEPYLCPWLEQNGRAICIDNTQLQTGKLEESLSKLWKQSAKATEKTTGMQAASQLIWPLLSEK